MGFSKRKPKIAGRKPRRKIGKKTNKVSTIKTLIRKELNKNLETKASHFSTSDGTQVPHNGFITIDNQLLSTTPGIYDPHNIQTQNRIGDEITFRGIHLKMMLELNERYSDVTYRILLVKAARGDTPTAANLFNGLSGNKMLDTINKERYTILYQKFGKLKAGNFGAQTASGGTLLGGGLFDTGGTNVNLYSRQTRIVKIWLTPKIMKLTKVTYTSNDGTGIVSNKFFDYHLLLYAYSNIATSDALAFNVLTLNDYIRTMYFKDA